MKLSKLFLHTKKDNPKDAVSLNQKLLIRAGYIQQVSAGIYVYGPLMWRVIRKIEQIVREEMDRAGAIELNLPLLQPKRLWDETDRWETYLRSGILFHLQDRKDEEYALAPTAEEVITNYVRNEVTSYRDLPVNLYQIGTKFRDELRPRFGLIRGREFIMKDAYSFDLDEKGSKKTYEDMKQAYVKICERCGFKYRVVEADSGAIGGSDSAEFMVLAETGEDTILECSGCDYGANLEKATADYADDHDYADSKLEPLKKVKTPGKRTVEDLCEFLKITVEHSVKIIIYETDKGDLVAVMMRGDYDINEVKLVNHLGVNSVTTASAEAVKKATGAEVGYAGPIKLNGAKLIADLSVKSMVNFECGGNETDTHYLNANFKRDFPTPEFVDLRNAKAGDLCAKCQKGQLKECKGIEVGHVFNLGSKYSQAMKLTVQHNDKDVALRMGCYGIGISRIAAAAVEQMHDEHGIVWPEEIAPYQVIVIPVSGKDEAQTKLAEEIYAKLQKQGVEVLLDDRDQGAGFKFKDAELIGIPKQIIVGRDAPKLVEFKDRKTGKVEKLSVEEALKRF